MPSQARFSYRTFSPQDTCFYLKPVNCGIFVLHENLDVSLERKRPIRIHPGGSIGMHRQDSGDDINYILSGKGKAICDGVEEVLEPGVCHICPQESEHSIINTGEEDLVMLTVVVHR